MNFDRAFELVIGHEGNYVNDPNDPGGETKYGISKRSYPKEDIKHLTLDRAKVIYFTDFWNKIPPEVPEKLRFHVFDFAVNSGVAVSISYLQKLLGIADDGIVGPVTKAALKQINDRYVAYYAIQYNLNRLQFMMTLKNWPHHGKGWTRRIIENIQLVWKGE